MSAKSTSMCECVCEEMTNITKTQFPRLSHLSKVLRQDTNVFPKFQVVTNLVALRRSKSSAKTKKNAENNAGAIRLDRDHQLRSAG